MSDCVCTLSREKEDHICHLREFQRQQVQQAESALESFKKQVELSSEKAYADMKQQVSLPVNKDPALWLFSVFSQTQTYTLVHVLDSKRLKYIAHHINILIASVDLLVSSTV